MKPGPTDTCSLQKHRYKLLVERIRLGSELAAADSSLLEVTISVRFHVLTASRMKTRLLGYSAEQSRRLCVGQCLAAVRVHKWQGTYVLTVRGYETSDKMAGSRFPPFVQRSRANSADSLITRQLYLCLFKVLDCKLLSYLRWPFL
jgi:hypothetical protein